MSLTSALYIFSMASSVAASPFSWGPAPASAAETDAGDPNSALTPETGPSEGAPVSEPLVGRVDDAIAMQPEPEDTDSAAPVSAEEAGERSSPDNDALRSAQTTPADDPKPVEEATDKKNKKNKKKKELDIDWKGRVVGGYRLKVSNPSEAQSSSAKTKHSLQLRQARLNLYGRFRDRLNLKISGDFADFLSTPAPGMVLRDAWANVRVHDLFQIKVGEFKRPYSALELQGVAKLQLVGRGLFNSAAIEDLFWGERGAGAMLWGKVKPKRPGLHRLEWSFSATNDATSGAQDGLDLHGRLSYAPLKLITVSAGGAFKYVEDFTGVWRNTFGADADITVKHKGMRLMVEADLAQDWSYQEANGDRVSPNMLGILGLASYDFELPKEFVLQPALAFEYADTNMLYAQSEAMRLVGNLNLRWSDHLVVRPQVEWVHPIAPVTALNQFVESQIYALWLQVQI